MISVPDFEFICRRFVDPGLTRDQRVLLMRFAFGGQLDEHDFHFVGLTWEFLSVFLGGAGFARAERVERFDLFTDSSAMRFGDELASLNVIAYK